MNQKTKHLGALASFLACVCLLPAARAANPGNVALEAAYSYNDNVSFASKSRNIFEDSVITLGATGNYTWQLSQTTAVKGSVGVQYNGYDKYTDITNLRVGAAGEFEFRPSRGFTSPWYTLYLRYFAADYDIDNRDGSTLELRALAGKRFTDRITGRAFLGYNNRDADDAFATEYTELVANMDYLISQQFVLYGGLGFRTGDVTSTAIPTTELIEASTAIEQDDAFGTDPDRFAYRLDADTTLANLGANYGFSRAAALDFSVQYYNADAGGYSLDYTQTIAWLAFLYRLE